MRHIDLFYGDINFFSSISYNIYDEERPPLAIDFKETKCIVENKELNNVDFIKLVLKGLSTDFGSSIRKGDLPDMVYFKNVNFQDSKFDSCDFKEVYFHNCNFARASLANTKFDKCSFVNCNLTGIFLPITTCIECVFSHINFTNVVVGIHCLFSNCRFEHCQGLHTINDNCKLHCVIVN